MAKGARDRSGSRGAALLREVRARLDRGWPPGLTVLTGEDSYHLDRAQAEILGRLAPPSDGPLAVDVFAGPDKLDIGRVVSAARTGGLFSHRRVVLVRDADLLDGDSDALQQFAESPPPEAYLVVRAPALDQRRKIHKTLASCGLTLRFARVDRDDPGEAAQEIGALAEERGLRLDREATQLVFEATRGDLYRAAAELDKLRAWAGGSAPISLGLAEVRSLVAADDDLSGWEIAEALLDRDAAGAIEAVRRLTAAGAEPLALIGGLAWRVRGMLRANAMLAGGAQVRDAVAAARAWRDGERFVRGLRRYRAAELLRMPFLLSEADRAIKSRSLDPGMVLERLVARMMAGAPAERA